MPRREDQIQKALVSHLKTRGAKGLFWYAVPNGGVRSKVEAKIMQSTGTRPGTPDLGFVFEGRAFFLEVKTENGRSTEHQLKAISDINAAGGYAAIGQGIDACLEILAASPCSCTRKCTAGSVNSIRSCR
jgi:hypothetical protein